MSKPDLGLPGRTPLRTRGGCRSVSVLALLLFLCSVGALGGVVFLYLSQQDQARAQFDPPTVLITEPGSGTAVPFGNELAVFATAFSHRPIARVELWLDGELKASQSSERAGGVSPFYARFNFVVPAEGSYMLFARAVDAAGIIGQSLPVGIVGKPRASNVPAFQNVSVRAGETLADIAKTYGTDPTTLQNMNPQLSNPTPAPTPPGDLVLRVPLPIPPAAPASPGSAPIPIPNVPPLQVAEPPLVGILVDPTFLLAAIAPPAAPTGLQAQVIDCKVRLRWNDNATNESGYEVWMAESSLSPRMIVQLKPAPSGSVWVEFPAPKPGYISFWVAAVNFFGKQPSNIVWVSVDPKCPSTLPTQLQVEALDMSVGGGHDRAYCYVSFENTPEKRVPKDSNQFIAVQGGKGDIANYAAGSMKFVIPIPTNGALDIAGECWGWAGKTLNKLGAFSSKFSSDAWDGKRRALEGGGFQIGVVVKALGAGDTGDTYTTYGYNDPTIPAPYDLKVEPLYGVWSSSGSNKLLGDPQERTLTWKWDGDPKKIDGFKIYLDGKPYTTGWLSTFPLSVNPNERQAKVRLPAGCGQQTRWEASAYAGEGESNLSKPAQFDLPQCPLYAHVTFKTIGLGDVRDSFGLDFRFSPCDTIEAWLAIYANDKKRVGGSWWADLYTGPKAASMTCGLYTFKQLFQLWYKEPNPDVLVVPLYGENPELTFSTRFQSPSENVGSFANWVKKISMSREQWAKFNQDFDFHGHGYSCSESVQINVKGSNSPDVK